MTLQEQVFAQAALLAGELDERKRELLRVLCEAAAASLAARLKEGLTPEGCGADFVTAASFCALAALEETREDVSVEEFKAGDLTVRKGSGDADGASRCLHQLAKLLMGPYLKDSFSFVGV